MYGLGVFVAVLGLAQVSEVAPRLPLGPAPQQVLAQLDNTGGLELIVPHHEYRQERNKDSVVLSAVLVEKIRSVPLSEVRVFRADGKEIDRERVPALITKQVRALCSADGKPVDPLHLLLVKEGTLVFMVPMDEQVISVRKE